MNDNTIMHRPHVAVIESNTLAAIGLKQILQSVLPFMEVDTFSSFEELQAADVESYFHYFVSVHVVVSHRNFFEERKHKTIVLSMADDPNSGLTGFHSLCISLPEEQLIKSVLQLEQLAHAHGKNLPYVPKENKVLSNREIEVLSLIVKGYLNKEIADQLNIGLTTVITHRKNIMEKLGVHSVSALTIYAVIHGYVSIDQI